MKFILSSLVPVALGLTAACSHAGDAAPAGTTLPSAAAGPTSGASRGGPAMDRLDPTDALLRATEGMTLTDAQSAMVATLGERLEANEQYTRGAFEKLQRELADQVRAGILDPTRVRYDTTAAVGALQFHIAMEIQTLDNLHAVLDASQRGAVVAAARSGPSGRAEMQADAPARPLSARPLAELTLDLDLDAAQEQQVGHLVAQRRAPEPTAGEGRQRSMDAVLDGFGGDGFDARTAVTAGATGPADALGARIEREVDLLAQLVRLLRPDQRERLASMLTVP